MDYRKLLEYYLTSDEWELELLSFFECSKHHYDPYEGTPDWGRVYLCSEVYLDHEKRLNAGGGTYFGLYLTPSQFERFFDEKYSSEHRFAVLFAMWWRLTDVQIRMLASLHNKRYCLQLLNYFLCNPEAAVRPSATELNSFDYSGKYVAEVFADRPTSNTRTSRIIPVKQILPGGSFLLETT